MVQTKKRPGRPLKPAIAGQRASLGLRISGDLKQRLDEAARKAGRTQGREAELRLERSFEAERVFEQTMELAYGRQLAAVLLLIGHVMKSVGLTNALLSTDHQHSDWFADAFAYDQAVQAANAILAAYRPAGDPERLATGDAVSGWRDNGKKFAELMLDVVDQATADDQFAQATFIRARLGARGDRPKSSLRVKNKGIPK